MCAQCGAQHSPVTHPGVLVAKVGYFGVKSAKVCRAQMGTKPAKVGRLGPRCAKVRRGPHPAPTGASAKRSSIHAPRAKLLKSAPRADHNKLLKWGRLRATRRGRVRVKSAKVRPQVASHKKVFAPQKKGLRSAGGPKLLKWDLSGRGSNLLKSDPPLSRLYAALHGFTVCTLLV